MFQKKHDLDEVGRRFILKGVGAVGAGLVFTGTTAAQRSNTVRISGGSPSRNVNYTFTVSGEVALGQEANHEDRVEGGDTAKGIVAGGTDSFEFSGKITSFSADGDVTVEINGRKINNPTRYFGPANTNNASSTLPRTIVVAGGSPQRNVNYTFTVSGEAELGQEANHEDRVEGGTTVKGIVAGSADSFRFSGEITSFNADGDLTVTVDGERVSNPVENPRPDNRTTDSGGNRGQCSNIIEIAGGEWSQNINYTFVVEGEAELGPDANHEDRVDGGKTVKGILGGGVDSYRFSGRIISFWSSSDVTVTINGQQVSDPIGHPTNYQCDLQDTVDCERVPTDLVIALDTSGSMDESADKFPSAKTGAKRLVSHLTDKDRVAVVAFDNTASLEVGLTQQFGRVDDTIDSLSADGDTDIAGAIQTAQTELARGQNQAEQCLVLLSDGQQTTGGDPLAEARRAKTNDIRLLTIAYGDDADTETLREIASDPPRSNAFVAAQSTIESVFDAIAQEVCNQERSDSGGGGSSPLSVSITGTNAPVNAGNRLTVTAHLQNTGRQAVSETVALIVGKSPEQVDSQTVSVPAGGSKTVTLGYKTYPAKQDTSFPVRVKGASNADQQTVTVYGTG